MSMGPYWIIDQDDDVRYQTGDLNDARRTALKLARQEKHNDFYVVGIKRIIQAHYCEPCHTAKFKGVDDG